MTAARRPLSLALALALALAVGVGLLAGLAALGASSVAPESAEAAPRTCNSPGSRTVRRTSAGRVFYKGPRAYACSSRYRKKFRLVEEDFQQGYGPFALTRSYLAYGSSYDDAAGPGGYVSVMVMNLRTGRHRHNLAASSLTDASARILDIVVKPNGSAAWIVTGTSETQPTPRVEVRTRDASGLRSLETGAGIDGRSLTLRGSTLSWRSGGAPRTATLR